MKARRLVLIFILLLIVLIVLGYFVTKPEYEDKYFAKEYVEKYSSPEIAYYHYVNSLISTDPGYYQEVLGRKVSERRLKKLKENPFTGERPKIVKMQKGNEDYVYIITDNNWGCIFERVNGRWVFSPEDIGSIYRNFLRMFKKIKLFK